MSEVKTVGEHKASWITISSDEHESMKSTLDILSDAELLEQIKGSEKDYKAGRYKRLHDLINEN